MGNSVLVKSTIKKIKEPDFSKEITISALHASKPAVDKLYNQLKQTLGDKVTDEQIWQRIQSLILRDNVFNEAMKILVDCYEFNIDEEELKIIMQRIKNSDPSLSSAHDEILKLLASNTIRQQMIFDALAIEWNISVSDDEVKAMLEMYYKVTNNSIREFLNNKDAIEGIKLETLNQKISDAICSKLKWKADWEAIKNAAAASAPKNNSNSNEQK